MVSVYPRVGLGWVGTLGWVEISSFQWVGLDLVDYGV